jgi:hypothetical protein
MQNFAESRREIASYHGIEYILTGEGDGVGQLAERHCCEMNMSKADLAPVLGPCAQKLKTMFYFTRQQAAQRRVRCRSTECRLLCYLCSFETEK